MSIDWTKLYKNYKGKWVALEDDERTVVGSGTKAKEALEEARQKGYDHPILHRVPSDLITYVGGALAR